MFAHILMFTPKPDLSDEKKRSFARVFRRAVQEIPSVQRAVVGRSHVTAATYGTQLGLKTYEYAAVLEFDDKQGLVDYLNHDAHRELGKMFWDVCEETAIVDCDLRELGSEDDDLLG